MAGWHYTESKKVTAWGRIFTLGGSILQMMLIVSVQSAEAQASCASEDGVCASTSTVQTLASPSKLTPLHRLSADAGVRQFVLSDKTNITVEVLHASNPLLFEIRGLLNHSEANALMDLARHHLREDTVSHGTINQRRQSRSAFFPHGWHDLVDVLNQRAADLTQVPLRYWAQTEPISVINYGIDGRYDGHFDSLSFANFASEYVSTGRLGSLPGGPRYITLMAFLNDVEDGGETIFPVAGWTQKQQQELFLSKKQESRVAKACKLKRTGKGMKIRPKAGTALLWYNHGLEAGTLELADRDPGSWHAGCRVKAGEKWIMNRWITAPLPAQHPAASAQPKM